MGLYLYLEGCNTFPFQSINARLLDVPSIRYTRLCHGTQTDVWRFTGTTIQQSEPSDVPSCLAELKMSQGPSSAILIPTARLNFSPISSLVTLCL